MNTLLIKSTLATAIALSIAACTPADSEGVAGIGGSGYVSSGSVSGFGSVFVNGVEFETGGSTFDVDGNLDGSQNDLAIGMIVQVSGTINDDGVTGTATNISYDDQLQGPVTGLTAPDTDGITRSFIVLGIKVIIDISSTTFDGLDFNSISNNNNVEISGFFDSTGNLNATRIELKDTNFISNSSIVELEGFITNYVNDSNFKIGETIIDATKATIDDLPNGLGDGQYIEVNGTYNTTTKTVTATKVEGEDNSPDDTDEFEIEGIITDYTSDSSFKVNGIPVDASSASREPSTLVLSNDARIEVEGEIKNGILVASEIESEGGDLKVHANVTDVDLDAYTFEVSPVSGQPTITITVTSNTQLEDDINDIEPYTLTNLFTNLYNNGGFVEVRGFNDGSDTIKANEIDVKQPDNILVQSVIQTGSSEASNIVKVLGVEFTIDYPSETTFEDADEKPLSPNEFFNAVTLDTTLIKVEDEDDDGVADKVEIKTP